MALCPNICWNMQMLFVSPHLAPYNLHLLAWTGIQEQIYL